MKKRVLSTILFSFALLTASSQTFEEFKKQREKEMQEFAAQQDKAISKLASDYNNYVEKENKAFGNYLEQEWKNFSLFTEQTTFDRRKPKKMPPFTPPTAAEPKKAPIEIKTVTPKPDTPLQKIDKTKIPLAAVGEGENPDSPLPIITKTGSDGKKKGEEKAVSFLGNSFIFHLPKALQQYRFTPPYSPASFSNAWQKLSNIDTENIIKQLHTYKNEYNLNDWALLKLCEAVASTCNSNHQETRIITWFLMNHCGYNIKLAYHNNAISLLMPTTTEVYGKKYIAIQGKKYYLIDQFKSEKIYTYDKSFPLAIRDIDLNVYRSMMLDDMKSGREITFDYQGTKEQFSLHYHPHFIEFYRDYPQTELEVYMNAPVSHVAKSSLQKALHERINEMSDDDAVNFILAMVQKGFEYKTDPEQFGYEKFFFPEEVLHYPFSDCEDRAALFSYLIRTLKGIDMIALEFPQHVATALYLKNASGDYITYNNRKYIIADPTFINAPYGKMMPNLKGEQVKIIPLITDRKFLNAKAWDIAYDAHCRRGGNHKDIAYDNTGNCYLAGYYEDYFDFGDFKKETKKGKEGFIASLNPEAKIRWILPFENKTDASFSIANAAQIVDGDLYISGIFQGIIEVSGKKISTKNSSAFVCKVDRNNQLQWIKQIALDISGNSRHITILNKRGEIVQQQTYPLETALGTSEGLSVYNNYLVLNNNLSSLSGKTEKRLHFREVYNNEMLITDLTGKYIQKKVDKSIAGIFAVIDILQQTGQTITGEDLMNSLESHQPNFKKQCPNIYKNLAKITMLRNNNGIITLNCKGKSVKFDKVYIKNSSTFQIKKTEEDNYRIDVIAGVEVGKLVVWYGLNYIDLYKNGNLLFDYDSDHTHAFFNLEKDILE